MIKASEIREKEIININNGAKLGLISDIEIDLEEARLKAIIMPKPGGFFNLFNKGNSIVIEWKDIVRIGEEVILVDVDTRDFKDVDGYI